MSIPIQRLIPMNSDNHTQITPTNASVGMHRLHTKNDIPILTRSALLVLLIPIPLHPLNTLKIILTHILLFLLLPAPSMRNIRIPPSLDPNHEP